MDSLIKLYGGFDVLQMNIEGFEYGILDSIKSLDIAQVIVSFHHRRCEEFSLEDTLDCIDKMQDLGYETVDIHDIDPEWVPEPNEELMFIKPSSSKKLVL